MPSPRALIYTYGTRGDVEPFAALCLGLQAAGFEVLLASSKRFSEWIGDYGIPFFAMSDTSLAAIESPDGKTMLEGGSGLLRRMAAGYRLAKKSRTINEELMKQTWAAAEGFEPDIIVYHSKLFAAPHVAEKLGVPAILATLQPMLVPTAVFPAFGLPELSLPGYNRLSYALVRRSFAMFKTPINRFRKDALGLPPIRKAGQVLQPSGAGTIPVLHAISPHVLPRPADWPDSAHLTGYWRLDKSKDYTPPPALAAFLENGPPPVFVGFGSMTSADPEVLGRLVTGALRKAGQRGIVAKGWAGLEIDEGGDILAIDPTPYDWLFPRMAAVVHHGGAGTAAEGFHAGTPSVICPFFGDQPGWARLSVALGVGATPVTRKRLSEDALAASILEAVSDDRLRVNAKRLARELRDEDGVKVAVDFVARAMRA